MLQWIPRTAFLALVVLVAIAALAGTELSAAGFSWTLPLGFSW